MGGGYTVFSCSSCGFGSGFYVGVSKSIKTLKDALVKVHPKAKQFTSSQCFGTTIQYRQVDIDRYGRTVATVYLEDGTELNLAILKAGFAWHYRRYSDRQDYADAEESARRAGIGLWADDEPTPPWEWRRERRNRS